MERLRSALVLLTLLAPAGLAATPARAQFDPADLAGGQFDPEGVGAKPAQGDVRVTAQFTTPKGDQPAYLFVTADIEPGWHIYSVTQPKGGPKATEIVVKASPQYEVTGKFRPLTPPDSQFDNDFGITIETHHGIVTWYAPIRLAQGVDPAQITIGGQVWMQRCKDFCLGLTPFDFTATLGKGKEIPPEAKAEPKRPIVPYPKEPAASSPVAAAEAEKSAEGPVAFDPQKLQQHVDKQQSGGTLIGQVLLGFLGGILLNLMPCVLPVIGLKILSFIDQAGEDRRRAFLLNVSYSAGLLSVFLVLAGLAVAAGLSWGGLFGLPGFTVTLSAIVFAMGLSFLGVWEIPIPGFVTTGGAHRLAQKEGFSAAFLKGVITTLLATPCLGPFMGSALAWAVRQPTATTFTVFTAVGLGMATPYLAIGAYPKLIRFLPKPGAWMETFKNVMGFVLMGTVVFILASMPAQYVVPTIGLLFFLWGAFWWIGRTPVTADRKAKLERWLHGAAIAGVGWIIMFPGTDEIFPGFAGFGGVHDVMVDRAERKLARQVALRREKAGLAADPDPASGPATNPSNNPGNGHASPQTSQNGPSTESASDTDQLPWRPFTTREAFHELLRSGKTVLIDVTADWCTNCKYYEENALNTRDVRELVDKNDVVTVQADWTEYDPEVAAMLKDLGGSGVPTVAIFSARNPNQPAIFRDGYYSEGDILGALRNAGPSLASQPPREPPQPKKGAGAYIGKAG